ncbi:MAG: serine/threonine protein kinase [Thiohalomonadales bacterium]
MSEHIDRYKIVKKISETAISVTYEAHDPGTGRYVAIKLLKVIENPEVEEEFIKETRVVGRLTHHNIVSIYDVGEHEGRAFIAMELLKGQSLAELMTGGKQFSWSLVANVASQLASALEYAHKQGVIHGDIRPGNIIWNREEDKLVLTDFGNAKQIKLHDTVTINVAQVNKSTPYLSPELIYNQQADNRSDLFSLGVVLYQMLTGFPPFSSEDFNDLTTQITKRAHKAISVSVTRIPEQFIKIIDKLLYKEPDERYQSASLLIQDLKLLPTDVDVPSPHTGKHVFKIAAAFLIIVSVGVLVWLTMGQEPEPVTEVKEETVPSITPIKPPPVVVKAIPEKIQISTMQASINAKLAKFECASLQASMTRKHEVNIKGHVSLEEDMISLMDLMDSFPGLANVTYEVTAIQWPFCEVVAILSADAHSNVSSSRGLKVTNSVANRRESGDRKLVFDIISPDYDAFLYVDYFHSNGKVSHLYQSQRNSQAKTKAASNLEISHPLPGGKNADPSEGLLVVLATYNPLLSKKRPDTEPAQQYLTELHREVVVNKVELSAAYLMLENFSGSNI